MRVLVANRPRLYQDLLAQALAEWPDLEVATELPVESAIVRATKEFQPDCLIVTLDKRKGPPPVCNALFARYPQLHIIAIGSNHNRQISMWFKKGIHTERVAVSVRRLVAAIRKRPSHTDERLGRGSDDRLKAI